VYRWRTRRDPSHAVVLDTLSDLQARLRGDPASAVLPSRPVTVDPIGLPLALLLAETLPAPVTVAGSAVPRGVTGRPPGPDGRDVQVRVLQMRSSWRLGRSS
jgi:hypothetical protein